MTACVEGARALRRGAGMNLRANTPVIRPSTETIVGDGGGSCVEGWGGLG